MGQNWALLPYLSFEQEAQMRTLVTRWSFLNNISSDIIKLN